MELIFLGTGGAWGLPEHHCPCATCRHLRAIGEHRTRAGLWLTAAGRHLLIDPGPDLRAQLLRENLPRPQAVLIGHEHGDHYLGLDDLLCFRRNLPPDAWRPIPTYATRDTWQEVERRFGYLLGSLLEKRLALPGEPLSGGPFGEGLTCLPVKTDHGPMPKGSVGFVLEVREEGRTLRVGYTGDLVGTPQAEVFAGLDLLVCQCHFLNEPVHNRPHHLSLQRALPLLARWRPGRVVFTHLSCQDVIPGDEPANRMLKKYPPAEPLCDPRGRPYPIPRDQAQWQETVRRVLADRGLDIPAAVACDGLRLRL